MNENVNIAMPREHLMVAKFLEINIRYLLKDLLGLWALKRQKGQIVLDVFHLNAINKILFQPGNILVRVRRIDDKHVMVRKPVNKNIVDHSAGYIQDNGILR